MHEPKGEIQSVSQWAD